MPFSHFLMKSLRVPAPFSLRPNGNRASTELALLRYRTSTVCCIFDLPSQNLRENMLPHGTQQSKISSRPHSELTPTLSRCRDASP